MSELETASDRALLVVAGMSVAAFDDWRDQHGPGRPITSDPALWSHTCQLRAAVRLLAEYAARHDACEHSASLVTGGEVTSLYQLRLL